MRRVPSDGQHRRHELFDKENSIPMSHVLRSNYFRFFVVFVACAALSLPLCAQSTVTGGIAGTVVDPQKAVVVDAKIAIRNTGTNVQISAVSDA